MFIQCSYKLFQRKYLKDIIQSNQDFDIKNFTDNLEYLRELSKYKYNLCPEGNNFESHRIWESLVLVRGQSSYQIL